MDITNLLQEAVDRHASDLHITVGVSPTFRVNGNLVQKNIDLISSQQTEAWAKELMSEKQYKRFLKEGESDLSYSLGDKNRYRINICRDYSGIAISVRVIPYQILTLDQLGHPSIVNKLITNQRGLIIVTGQTGSGKTTTLAAMIDQINNQHACHILTLEDPIEFVHKHKKSIINQREIRTHTKSFKSGLRAGLRQDPDVILIGEMRDSKTIAIAITAAETGHLVLATLHTGDAAQSIDRMIDVFPEKKQQQIRMQLSMSLQGIISQQLIPRQDGSGRVAALEVLTATPAVRSLIRNGCSHQILATILDSKKHGMIDMDTSIKTLYLQGVISHEEAIKRMINPGDLKIL